MPLNIDIQQILLHMFNFAIIFAAVYFLFYNPIKKFMDNRNNDLEKQINEIDKSKKEVDSLKEEYTAKLNQIDNELTIQKEKATEQSQKQANEIIKQANEKADKILADARNKAKVEKEAIVKGAYSEIYELAKEAAEKVVYSSSESYDKFLESVNEDGE